jgi:hypothetical protein
MIFPTWGQLAEHFCAARIDNPYHEEFASRRYNFGASSDHKSCRLIFLKGTSREKENRTLRRAGRFIWCRNLRYEGVNHEGLRSISFTVDKGQKRFHVGENNILCLPSKVCVTNSRYFRSNEKTFLPFSSVFSYKKSVNMMVQNSDYSHAEALEVINNDNPFRSGTLVAPRLGYFHPNKTLDKINKDKLAYQDHPCGIILGPSPIESEYVTKEFYRVRFGKTTYERIHPVQMEIINEV